MTPPLGPRLIDTPSHGETPEGWQMRTEIREKMARIHELMTKATLFPVVRGDSQAEAKSRPELEGRSFLNFGSPDYISGVIQYNVGKTPETTKDLTVWLASKVYGASIESDPDEEPETEPEPGSKYTKIFTRVELMTQAVIRKSQTGLIHLVGPEKVRATARPSRDKQATPLVFENMTTNEFSHYSLEEQLSVVNDILATIELIAAAPKPDHHQPLGILAVSTSASEPKTEKDFQF